MKDYIEKSVAPVLRATFPNFYSLAVSTVEENPEIIIERTDGSTFRFTVPAANKATVLVKIIRACERKLTHFEI